MTFSGVLQWATAERWQWSRGNDPNRGYIRHVLDALIAREEALIAIQNARGCRGWIEFRERSAVGNMMRDALACAPWTKDVTPEERDRYNMIAEKMGDDVRGCVIVKTEDVAAAMRAEIAAIKAAIRKELANEEEAITRGTAHRGSAFIVCDRLLRDIDLRERHFYGE